jgi:energy-coupling factor transporter ATP-binding protein EcfA2
MFRKIFNPSFDTESTDLDAFLKNVESGVWKNRLVTGISENGFESVDPINTPGVLCIGTMGSGKSFTLVQILNTLALTSSENTVFFLHDPGKEMGDYANIKTLTGNACYATGDIQKMVPFMKVLFDEYSLRKITFKELGTDNIKEYNRLYKNVRHRSLYLFDLIKTGKYVKDFNKEEFKKYLEANKETIDNGDGFHKDFFCDWDNEFMLDRLVNKDVLRIKKNQPDTYNALKKLLDHQTLDSTEMESLKYYRKWNGAAYIIVAIEEFSVIPNHPSIMFFDNKNTYGTLAYKLKEIQRLARSYGFCFLAAAQRASADDIPSDLRPGFNTVLAHRVSSNLDVGAYDIVGADKIPNRLNGRSIDKEGIVRQSPYIKSPYINKLLAKYVKPCTAELFGNTLPEIQKVFNAEGADGMIKNYDLTTVLQSADAINDYVGIVMRVLSMYGYKRLNVPKTGSIELTVSRNDKTYGVMIVKAGRQVRDSKKMDFFIDDIATAGLDEGIYVSFQKDDVNQTFVKRQWQAVDMDDMSRMASIVDDPEKYDKELLKNFVLQSPDSENNESNELE